MDGFPEQQSAHHSGAGLKSDVIRHPHDGYGDYGVNHDHQHDEGGIDLTHIRYLLLRRSWIILLVVLIGGIPVTAWVLRKPVIYQSTGIIMVEPKEEKVLKTEAVSQESLNSLDYLNTVVRALSSRAFLVTVVQDNKLGKNPSLNPSGELSETRIATLIASKMEVHLRKGTRLIEVTVTDGDPALARQLANQVISGFMKDVYRQRSTVARSAADFLTEEAGKLRAKLLDSEHRLQRYKEEHDSVSLQQNQNIIVDKLHQLNASVTTAEDKRLKIESDLEQFRHTDPDDTADLLKIPSVAALPQVASISQQITQASTELGTLKERYLPLHPKYISYQNRIRSLQEAQVRIVKAAGEDLAKQVESARQNELKIKQLLKEQEEKSLQLDKLGIEYNALKRDVDTDSALYSSVIARMKEAGVSAENDKIPYRIAEDPLPGVPVPSNGPLVIGGTLLFLVLFSAAGIVAHDMLGAGVKSVDQAERLLGLPALGCIPEIKNMTDRNGSLVVINQPSSVEAEAFRTLRAGIILHDRDKSLRGVTLVTSAVPEEGKSTIALNLAASFAMVGEPTLLIDADLRRPSVQKVLGLPSKGRGLSDVLEGRCVPEEAIRETGIDNLSVMTAGGPTSRPAEIFSTPDLGRLVDSIRGRFAHIVIDTPPVNAVADTLILSHHADRVLVVLRSERTPLKAIRRAIHLLKKSTPVVAGTIINRLQRSGAGYYYYYYGGKYSKDSGYGDGRRS
jgi:succinoglycan biosynthesis transport protein ExoP